MNYFSKTLTILAIAALSTAPVFAAESKLKFNKRDFVSAKKIDRAGGVTVMVPGVGKVKLKSVKTRKKGGSRCFVHIPSVVKHLQDSGATAGVVVSISLKLTLMPTDDDMGDIPICEGGGEDCIVTVEL